MHTHIDCIFVHKQIHNFEWNRIIKWLVFGPTEKPTVRSHHWERGDKCDNDKLSRLYMLCTVHSCTCAWLHVVYPCACSCNEVPPFTYTQQDINASVIGRQATDFSTPQTSQSPAMDTIHYFTHVRSIFTKQGPFLTVTAKDKFQL